MRLCESEVSIDVAQGEARLGESLFIYVSLLES
ncbi:MAG: hypothetical protein J07HQW2_00187 [Haloquadratum walsbyi J07HQW2]|uniref:Uncharacterized protein n=1 Tax=Haloquadratum walsbyi J07HQW2 TaxID=1238425 RepID=U1NAV9_9EURY|nr:MAG: hypothetical protein J07HQW2_00187 [Haloquadratum walsbyi J07HQW2]